jgi:hypothetical protein
MPWAVVETQDEDTGEMLTHILPVVKISGFNTEQEAIDFREKCIAAGGGDEGKAPVLTDKEDNVTATFFGHVLKAACVCGPQRHENDPWVYTHREAN